MDKKTLRRIIENLKKDSLIITKDFQIKIKPHSNTSVNTKTEGFGQIITKTILLAPDCKLTDDELMRENQTIANPTNKKVKHEYLYSDEEEEIESNLASIDYSEKVKNSLLPTEKTTRVLRSSK